MPADDGEAKKDNAAAAMSVMLATTAEMAY
jgi:hypothetical protein